MPSGKGPGLAQRQAIPGDDAEKPVDQENQTGEADQKPTEE